MNLMVEAEQMREFIDRTAVYEAGNQTVLAKAIGISPSTLKNWLNGRIDAEGRTYHTISEANVTKVRRYLLRKFAYGFIEAPSLSGRRSERELFARRIAQEGITDHNCFGISSGEISYQPKGGLTDDDLEAFRPFLEDEPDLLHGLEEAILEAESFRLRAASRRMKKQG
jgi:transcriptional regulator with XRE-family HTH domain